MHDMAFADATRPTPCVVLKLALRAYSIGHETLLLRERNPLIFLSESDFSKLPEVEQRRALLNATLVCANSWRQNHSRQRWLRLWGWLIRKEDLNLALAKWRHYRAAGTVLPKCADKESAEIAGGKASGDDEDVRELGAPFLAQLYIFAHGLGSVELRQWGDCAWDVPFSLAGWLYLTALESEGRAQIENAREMQVREEMAEHRAAVKAEEEGRKHL